MIPKDPVILLSYVNTKLRDEYSSIEELCKSIGCDKNVLELNLSKIGYHYCDKINQFK